MFFMSFWWVGGWQAAEGGGGCNYEMIQQETLDIEFQHHNIQNIKRSSGILIKLIMNLRLNIYL